MQSAVKSILILLLSFSFWHCQKDESLLPELDVDMLKFGCEQGAPFYYKSGYSYFVENISVLEADSSVLSFSIFQADSLVRYKEVTIPKLGGNEIFYDCIRFEPIYYNPEDYGQNNYRVEICADIGNTVSERFESNCVEEFYP